MPSRPLAPWCVTPTSLQRRSQSARCEIAAEICVYTNDEIVVEEMGG